MIGIVSTEEKARIFSCLSRLPASKGMFVVLAANAGSMTNDRYVDAVGCFFFFFFFTLQILEIPTDRPKIVCEKNCPILGKAYMFKEEL